jgi:hypothetical protein
VFECRYPKLLITDIVVPSTSCKVPEKRDEHDRGRSNLATLRISDRERKGNLLEQQIRLMRFKIDELEGNIRINA